MNCSCAWARGASSAGCARALHVHSAKLAITTKGAQKVRSACMDIPATSPPYSALGALLHIASARKFLFGVRGAGLGRLFDLRLSMVLSLRSLIFATISRVVWLIRFARCIRH